MFRMRQGLEVAASGGRACLATRAAALEAPAVRKEDFRRHLERLISRGAGVASGRAVVVAQASAPRLPDSNEWAPAPVENAPASRRPLGGVSSGRTVLRLPDTNEWAPPRPDHL